MIFPFEMYRQMTCCKPLNLNFELKVTLRSLCTRPVEAQTTLTTVSLHNLMDVSLDLYHGSGNI